MICELADAYEIGLPPPHWFTADDETLATMLELLKLKAQRYDKARRRKG